MHSIKQIAIIGATASGKSSLAIALAKQHNAHILSLDSLALYKQIDIVSAKPTPQEQEGIRHFGIDLLYPNEHFDVKLFIDLYHEVYQLCQNEQKDLIIVGGTSFYLKRLLEGISPAPLLSTATQHTVQKHLQNLQASYDDLYARDPHHMQQIAPNDRYRIQKSLEIYLATSQTPTEYFRAFPPKPTITQPLPIYQIHWSRDLLRQRIAQRTQQMMRDGLIDEVVELERRYTRSPNPMRAIGIKETLAYLDGFYNKTMLMEKITTHTAQLAKRQETFNSSQFQGVIRGSLEDLSKRLLKA
jgi:tRNA dimethylallyltransferase